MVNAAQAQRARTRARMARIERQVAVRDSQRPAHVARARRIRGAKRDLRRALRARDAARRAVGAAEIEAGGALRRLCDEGLALGEVAALCGLSPNAVRRLRCLTRRATGSDTAALSTEVHAGGASADLVGDRGAAGVPKGADHTEIDEGNF